MKILLQQLDSGKTTVVDCPEPTASDSNVIVDAKCSLISAGTERMLVGFGRASLFGKVSQARDKLKDIFAKIRSSGIRETYQAVRAKLKQPITLGYALVGVVRQAHETSKLKTGDRVVTNSYHANVAQLSPKLCVKIPDNVKDDEASFTPLAAIANQGIHLLAPKAGDKVMVVGLGLIGQLAARLLVARGCIVLGLDPSKERLYLATKHGVHPAAPHTSIDQAALSWTHGKGVDGVIIAASSPLSDIVNLSALGCAPRAKIVSVGVVGLDLKRPIFFKSEVTVQVSYSNGDKTHQGPGSMYANFSEILDYLASGKLNVNDLISRRYNFNDAPTAYDELVTNSGALGIILDYPNSSDAPSATTLKLSDNSSGPILIGAGNFASRTLLPALKKLGDCRLAQITSRQGYQALLLAREFNAGSASTDEAHALTHPPFNPIFLCTRHDVHARQAIAALSANKSVWVEKPLGLTIAEIDEIQKVALQSKGTLMVGFNRRFAPATQKLLRKINNKSEPKKITITINAGRLDRDHWTLNPTVGGGRIVGEGCHFVDLARALIGKPITSITCTRRDTDGQDGGCFELFFADNSTATIDYRTDLPPELPKENIEISGQDWSAIIHNWTRLTSKGLGVSQGWPWSGTAQKGHPQALKAFIKATEHKSTPPIPLEEIIEVSKAAIQMQHLTSGAKISF